MMISTDLILPAMALILITLLVWLNMLVRRIVSTTVNNIDLQAVNTPEQFNAVMDSRTQAVGNCFKNLFELPVLFYALVAFSSLLGLQDSLNLSLAWAFVGLRAVHAAVFCTYNRVVHRFLAYLASSIILWVLVVRVFLSLV